MLLTRSNPAVVASLASPCLQFIAAPAPNTFPADSQALSGEGSDAALPPHLLKCRRQHPAGEAVRPGCYLDGTCRVRVGATTSPGIDKPLVGPAGKPFARPSASPSREGIYRDGTGWRHLEARLQQAPRWTWQLYPLAHYSSPSSKGTRRDIAAARWGGSTPTTPLLSVWGSMGCNPQEQLNSTQSDA